MSQLETFIRSIGNMTCIGWVKNAVEFLATYVVGKSYSTEGIYTIRGRLMSRKLSACLLTLQGVKSN